nr:unnamed protein product [Callosobruchus analis]CAI5829690.1 unnamed protein product [Callosobruchus analis]CAI5840211.1 unnamed protein product [Callosobruchus analis]CAI5854856.1 unnamed protein product [Callosobruchus analis]CAI5865875.1 unnamed protein product [Callosobruchus analis]
MDNLFIKNQTGRKPTAFLGMDEPATRFEVQIPNTVYYMLDQSRNEHCYTPIMYNNNKMKRSRGPHFLSSRYLELF